nr:TPM domain-containing protein [Polaromonas sp. AER18D-145]
MAQAPVPPLTGHVIDLTGTLAAEQKASLEKTLTAFEARKGSQLAVLIVPSSAPEEIEQFSLRVAEQWKLGRKKVDDGAILVVAKNDRTLRIEVGYGLEGPLNDATSKRIISEAILPRFRQQDFYGGITAGVEQIIRVVDGEPLPAPIGQPATSTGDVRQYAPILFIVALAVGGVLRATLGKVPGSLVTGGAVAVVAWLIAGALSVALLAGVIALFITLLGGGMGGHGHGGHYGGVGRGGFGGGGFRGGGGGFGGGGASGRW